MLWCNVECRMFIQSRSWKDAGLLCVISVKEWRQTLLVSTAHSTCWGYFYDVWLNDILSEFVITYNLVENLRRGDDARSFIRCHRNTFQELQSGFLAHSSWYSPPITFLSHFLENNFNQTTRTDHRILLFRLQQANQTFTTSRSSWLSRGPINFKTFPHCEFRHSCVKGK